MSDQKNYATKKCIFQKMNGNGNLKTYILSKKLEKAPTKLFQQYWAMFI